MNIKNLSYLILALGFSFASCTKVIDVKLDDTEPVIVIEGNITDTVGPYMVRVSKTIDIDQDNNFPGVGGATVTITDDAGNSETLLEQSTGTYIGTTLQGVPGRTYTLTVATNDGNTYVASSTMPQKIQYDSLGLRTITDFAEDATYPVVYYRDPPGQGNYYRAVRYVNNIPDGELYIESDELIDGKNREAVLINQGPPEERNLNPGDIVTVEVQCIDKQMYDYLIELSEADGNSQAATPANPYGNISNSALGYFSAHTSETKKLDLP